MSILEDLDERLQRQQEILLEISDVENMSQTTLKEKIKLLIDVTRPLVESGHYPDKNIKDLCSIIRYKLTPYNISSIEQRAGWFYNLFDETERANTRGDNSDNKSLNISSKNELPIDKRTGINKIDKIKEYFRNSDPLPDDYQYRLYLRTIKDVSDETIKQTESLTRKLESAFYHIKKFDEEYPDKKELQTELRTTSGKFQKELSELYTHYLSCEDVIKDIESGIGSTQNKIDELNETLATQKFISKQIDERSKITFLEKWNTIIAEIEIGISAIAKKLGVNKKHISNNIRPKNNPVTDARNKHHDYISWFTHISVVTPEGKRLIFDAKNYFDSQIERAKLQVPFEDLILRNCEIE